MNVGEFQVMTDVVAKFHRSIFVYGWFQHESQWLNAVSVEGEGVLSQVAEVGMRHGAVPALRSGAEAGFRVQCLRSDDSFPEALSIAFRTNEGNEFRLSLQDLSDERRRMSEVDRIYERFSEMVRSMPSPVVIDVGGRDRSGFDRSKDFPDTEYVVVDIVPGSNVDLVGDAHALASVVQPESADAVVSVSTFEHLLMPWKTVVEINKVLKPGGIVCVRTHQTLGMHELPWDFWRFSSDGWSALFNRFTGFEILDRADSGEQFVVPFLYHPGKAGAERSAGFEFTAVLARKIGPSVLDWPVSASDVTHTVYPTVVSAS